MCCNGNEFGVKPLVVDWFIYMRNDGASNFNVRIGFVGIVVHHPIIGNR